MEDIKNFVINDEGELVEYVGENKKATDFVIPEDVTYIAEWAFLDNKSIRSLKVKDNVKSIFQRAFYGCENLEEVDIPYGVEIEKDAFGKCPKLADKDGFVIINDRLLEYYGDEEDIVIPDNVVEIVSFFADNHNKDRIKSIKGGKNLKAIGEDVFMNCPNLKKVDLPEGVKLGRGCFCGCSKLVNDNGFLIVNGYLFDYLNNEETVVIPDTVMVINNFNNYSGSRRIDYYRIKNVIVPKSVERIARHAVYSEDKDILVLKGKNTVLDEDAVYSRGGVFADLKYSPDDYVEEKEVRHSSEIDMDDVLRKIRQYEGYMDFSWDMFSVDDNEYAACRELQHLVLGDHHCGDNAFRSCHNLQSVASDGLARKLGRGTFKNCERLQDTRGFVIVNGILFDYFGGEENVEIPDGVSEIDVDAFKLNHIIRSVKIPSSVRKLKDGCFEGCINLKNIEGRKSLNINERLFNSKGQEGGYEIEVGYLCSYKDNTFPLNLVLPEGIRSIKSGIFKDYNLQSIYIPEGVKTIEPYAFKGCLDLEKVYFPKSLESIGEGAFEGCRKLENINIPEGLKYIGKNAFNGTHIKNWMLREKGIMFEGELLRYDRLAFMEEMDQKRVSLGRNSYEHLFGILHRYSGTALSFTVPEDIICINRGAFCNNDTLEEIELPDGLIRICDYAFMGCRKLKRIVIPKSVEYIDSCAFMGCENLEEVVISPNTKIGNAAFAHCPKLRDKNGFVIVNHIVFETPKFVKGIKIPADIRGFDANIGNRKILEYSTSGINELRQKYYKARMGRLLD